MAKQEAFSVMLDSALQSEIDAYCEMHAVDRAKLVQEAMAEFMRAHDPELSQLVSGYTEMAAINAEICREFTACESEAYSHIH